MKLTRRRAPMGALASTIGFAADNALTIFDRSGHKITELHPGYVAKHDASPGFAEFETVEAGY